MSVTKTGVCEYCGQSQMVECEENTTEERVNELASEKCGCSEAKEARELRMSEEKARQNVEKLFGKYDAAEVLKVAVHPVAICAIDSVTVNVGNGVKGTVLLNNGKVKVKKVVTTTNELEN